MVVGPFIYNDGTAPNRLRNRPGERFGLTFSLGNGRIWLGWLMRVSL